jgi:hypothetical protein
MNGGVQPNKNDIYYSIRVCEQYRFIGFQDSCKWYSDSDLVYLVNEVYYLLTHSFISGGSS